ncbi:MAG: hypothetical protein GSR85_01160 [Desulfurococcales archaeon]|nr:hypothetical protein [Desulfurococcales archaeon]
MEKERVVIEAEDYVLEITRGLRNPSVEDDRIKVGDLVLELDVKTSLLGESLASLLLPPIDIDNVKGDAEWFKSLLDRYRLRVISEQAYDLGARSGRLVEVLEIPLSYMPLSRMSMFKNLYPCIFNKYADESGLTLLEEEYRDTAERIGILFNGRIVIKPARVKDFLLSMIKSTTMPLSVSAATLTFKPPRKLGECSPRELLREPWKLLKLPEGRFSLTCKNALELARDVLDGSIECSSPSLISSSIKCSSNTGVVVVKEYRRMYIKWIPTYIAGYTKYKYRVSPKSRLAAEYHYLRVLRRITRTPRIYSVCVEYYTGSMVREYIEGTPVLESKDKEDWRLAGETLAEIHNKGITLGDPNPGNFLVTHEDKPAIIDAEQARPATLHGMAWDLGVLAIYSLIMNKDKALVEEAFKGYKSKANRAEETLKLLGKDRFWAQFMLLPHIISKIKTIATTTLNTQI